MGHADAWSAAWLQACRLAASAAASSGDGSNFTCTTGFTPRTVTDGTDKTTQCEPSREGGSLCRFAPRFLSAIKGEVSTL
ncbi:hypothetical protein J4573_17960 [Actinomadura barringtoniae]|uniref:Uncharacterized protein n=1 Tax=Actinomadura barringtoniae TaxID=1427535 RepID=A0A939PAS1_9ACTN|nr:hypothetical protein [Actinomadura barringtoniae]MBO2448993.1 hypothetical protein [Actinomadura barringtoniae]